VRKKKHPEHVNHERWLISYADFITLLFAFFVVMFAVSQVDTAKVGRFTESFQSAIGMDLVNAGSGIMPGEGSSPIEGKRNDSLAEGSRDKLDKQLKALADSLDAQAKIKKELSGLKIIRRGNELILRLDASVLFETAIDEVTPDAQKVLLAIAEELKGRPVKVRVEGHTDDRPIQKGRFRNNWDLSTSRATNVVIALAATGDIAPERLAAVGYAQFHPLGDNSTHEGRLLNRRVDFVLTVEVPNEAAEQPLNGTAANPPLPAQAEDAKPEPAADAAAAPEPPAASSAAASAAASAAPAREPKPSAAPAH
jgi:chemotaxis protein MotB